MTKRKIILIVSLGLVFRLVVLFILKVNPWEPDSRIYFGLAEKILDGKGLGGSGRYPPLYPLFLAGIYGLSRNNTVLVQLVQTLISGALILCVYLLGKQVFSQETGLLAAFLVAIDPFLNYFNAKLLSETLFIFLLVLSFLLLVRSLDEYKFSFSTGLCFGLSNLCRSVIFGFVPLVVIGCVSSQPKKMKFLLSTFFICGVLVILFPWTIRNYLIFKKFVPLSLQKGWNMAEGLNPNFEDPEASRQWTTRMGEETKHMTEIERDDYLWRKSITWIKSYPKEFSKLAIRKFFKFWRLYPYAPYGTKEKVISAIFFTPLLFFSIIGIFLSFGFWRKLIFFYLLFFYFSLTAMLFWTQIRYRLSLHPFLGIFSAYALHNLAKKLAIIRS